jgi:hypothetical protein
MEYSDNEESDFYADGPDYINQRFRAESDETQKTEHIDNNSIGNFQDGADKYNSQYLNNISELVPVKPRKITASTSDFQMKFKTEICLNW